MNIEMKLRYRMFRKASGIYFIENRVTGQQKSLKTRDKEAAVRIFNAQNEAHEQPAINLQIARAYLMASDPLVVRRTWQHAMDEIVKTKQGSTHARWLTGIKDKAFDPIRKTPLIETQAEHLLNVLSRGTVSTNVHLRKLHNFCLDMNWLPWPVVPKRQWPEVRFKEKRAITFEEHQAILAREKNPERKAFYQLCWFIGGSQGDIAQLLAEDVDWEHSTLSFRRRKTRVPVVIRLGQEASSLLKDLPSEGPLFPYLCMVRSGDRATEFHQRCKGLGIVGVSLHSYRYAWAERAKAVGYPERYAMQALGHNSAAVHRSYAKGAQMTIPALEEYEPAQPKKTIDEACGDRV
jgi:integrase